MNWNKIKHSTGINEKKIWKGKQDQPKILSQIIKRIRKPKSTK